MRELYTIELANIYGGNNNTKGWNEGIQELAINVLVKPVAIFSVSAISGVCVAVKFKNSMHALEFIFAAVTLPAAVAGYYFGRQSQCS